MAPNLDFVMQTLGAIVQAYASILTIAGAVYIFIIDKKRSEKSQIEQQINSSVNNLIAYCMSEPLLVHILKKLDFWEVKEFNSQLLFDKIKDEDVTVRVLLFKYPDFINFVDALDRRDDFIKENEKWSYRLFNPIIFTCILELLLTICFMYYLSITEYLIIDLFIYTILIVIAILGFIVLVLLFDDIAKFVHGTIIKSK